jgi:hypothetical protein
VVATSDARTIVYYMPGKVLTRSVRLDEETNTTLEAQAAAAGLTVSEYLRWAIAELAARDHRVKGRRQALATLASLPAPDDPDAERAAMWGTSERVPR